MNEAIEPSCTSRFFARLLALGQLIVLGPLTLLSTILSSTLCCCCIYMKYKSDGRAMDSTVFQEMFSTCMSSWGIFWMFLLFVLPLGIALGTLAGSLVVAVVVMIYPCYASYRYVLSIVLFVVYMVFCVSLLLWCLLLPDYLVIIFVQTLSSCQPFFVFIASRREHSS